MEDLHEKITRYNSCRRRRQSSRKTGRILIQFLAADKQSLMIASPALAAVLFFASQNGEPDSLAWSDPPTIAALVSAAQPANPPFLHLRNMRLIIQIKLIQR